MSAYLDARAGLAQDLRGALVRGDFEAARRARQRLSDLIEAVEAPELARVQAERAAARRGLDDAERAWARGPSAKTREQREQAYERWRGARVLRVWPECLRVPQASTRSASGVSSSATSSKPS
jgi:dihydrodipicolinate synthase/N-acetylneuraminate lyase